jgi:hypothetical protein
MPTPIAQFSKSYSTIPQVKKAVKAIYALGGKAIVYAKGNWIADDGEIGFADGTQVIGSIGSKKCSVNFDGEFVFAKPLAPNSLPFRIDADIY